jgi:hypothetical protein
MSTEQKQINSNGFWISHSSAWKASSKTKQEYCEQHGLSFRSFVYQHRRIVLKAKKANMNFIEAKSDSINSSQSPGLQLILPNGVRIGISNDINITMLQSVLKIAGAL